jgi:hypothetical protein
MKIALSIPTPAPAPLPTLVKRQRVRVIVPRSLAVYARVRPLGRAGAGARCLVGDLSAGGMSAVLMEGSSFDLPREGEEAHVALEHDGEEASATARVVRSSAERVSLAFHPGAGGGPADADLNLPLLALIARLVARRADHVDHHRWADALATKLTHRHFYGAGYLDVRVETASPAWWQVVFLEYVIAWSQRSGALTTGIIDRSFSSARATDPLAVGSDVARHATPWPRLLQLAAIIAGHCAAAQPAHADAFDLVQRTLRRG